MGLLYLVLTLGILPTGIYNLDINEIDRFADLILQEAPVPSSLFYRIPLVPYRSGKLELGIRVEMLLNASLCNSKSVMRPIDSASTLYLRILL